MKIGGADRRIILRQQRRGLRGPVTVLHGLVILEIPCRARDLGEVLVSAPLQQLFKVAVISEQLPFEVAGRFCE